jgi:hypothetical protein
MNKSETRQIAIIKTHYGIGNITSAALGLSALIRCAMTAKSKRELLEVAAELNLISHPDFII